MNGPFSRGHPLVVESIETKKRPAPNGNDWAARVDGGWSRGQRAAATAAGTAAGAGAGGGPDRQRARTKKGSV